MKYKYFIPLVLILIAAIFFFARKNAEFYNELPTKQDVKNLEKAVDELLDSTNADLHSIGYENYINYAAPYRFTHICSNCACENKVYAPRGVFVFNFDCCGCDVKYSFALERK